MGLLEPGLLELASHDRVVSHVGLATFWAESVGTSFGQCGPSRIEYRIGFSVVAPVDRCTVAECIGGGAVWVASGECGIGGMDHRNEEYPVGSFLLLRLAVLSAV